MIYLYSVSSGHSELLIMVAVRRYRIRLELLGLEANQLRVSEHHEVRALLCSHMSGHRFLPVSIDPDELHGAVFVLILPAALREGEAKALRWRDLDLDGPDEPHLWVEQSVPNCEGGKVIFGELKRLACGSKPLFLR